MAHYRTTRQPTPESPTQRWPLWSVWLFIVVVIGAMASVIASAVVLRQHTSPVGIHPADKNAQIIIARAGEGAQIVGKGDTAIRLQPGVYQVTAASGQGATSRRLVVSKDTAANVDLPSAPTTPVRKIANYHARHIYTKDDMLYFLNEADGIPYAYRLGSDAARPYFAALNSVRSMHWLGPTEILAENNGGKWSHLKDGLLQPFAFEGASPNADSASLNKDGIMAFVAGKRIVSGTQAGGDMQPVGDTQHSTTRVSVAPNGNMLVYTPRVTDRDPSEPTRLYEQGTFTPLGEDLTGIANVRWNTDSSAFSYTTRQGGFIYDLQTKTSTHLLASTPTNPNSALWVSPTSVVYADSGAIWNYDIGRGISNRVATIDGNLGITPPFHMTDDGKTIYFSTASGIDGKTGTIYSFMPGYHGMSKQEQADADAQHPPSQRVKAYVNLNGLVDNGLTPDQTQSVKYALGEFAGTNDTAVNVITLRDFKTKLANDPREDYEVTFKLTTNNTTTYDARLMVTNISAIRLFIMDEGGGRQLFDSGPIKTM